MKLSDMSNLEALIQSAAAMGAAQVLEVLGLSAGEISGRKAKSIYGTWFMEAVKSGRLRPTRVGDGYNGKHSYRITDILQLRTADLMMAEIQMRNNP